MTAVLKRAMRFYPADKLTRDVVAAALTVTGGILLWMLALHARNSRAARSEIFNYLILYLDLPSILPYAAILLAALYPPVQRAGVALAHWCSRHPWRTGIGGTVVLALGARLVYHAHPLSMDEYAPLFQSEAFAEGMLTGRFPPELIDWLVPAEFQNVFIRFSRSSGAVASMYWPGFALLLTPFTALGMPWILNPLIGGATAVAMQKLGWKLFCSHEHAGLVMLCTLGSTAVAINAMSFYSMPSHLLANVLFTLLLIRPSPLRAVAAGLVGSLALVLHNPFPHMVFALPWLVYLALRPDRLKILPCLMLGYMPLCVLVGWGWFYFVRDLGVAAAPAVAAQEAGPIAVAFEVMTRMLVAPTTGIVEARILGLAKLWLWSTPALLAAAAIGAWRLREDRGVWFVLAASALLTYLAYFFFPHSQGHGWSYRYFHGSWLVLPLFAVAAVRTQDPESPGLYRYLAGCAVLGMVLMIAVHAFGVERFVRGHLARLPQLEQPTSGEARIVFVSRNFYSQDLVQNDPFLRERRIIFISRGTEEDEALMRQRFPQYTRLAQDERGSVWGTAVGR